MPGPGTRALQGLLLRTVPDPDRGCPQSRGSGSGSVFSLVGMGLMEVEVALLEHRQKIAASEALWSRLRTARERAPSTKSGSGKADWPVLTLRLGPLRLALFRTVRLPAGHARDWHGTPGALPG